MKTKVLLSALSLAACGALASPGCGSGGSTGGSTTTSNSSSSTGGSTTTTSTSSSTTATSSTSSTTSTTSTTTGYPPPPTLGAQIDRLGRPAINTALNHAFDATAAAGPARDAYNQASDATQWATSFAPQIASNLAILDALDGVCGNQLGYMAPASPTSYGALAGTLAHDVLWLDTAGTTCTQYLAVEANALGVQTNTDCGGRALAYDVIDETYSVLAIGKLTGVSDGVPMNDVPFLTSFPYLAAPH